MHLSAKLLDIVSVSHFTIVDTAIKIMQHLYAISECFGCDVSDISFSLMMAMRSTLTLSSFVRFMNRVSVAR